MTDDHPTAEQAARQPEPVSGYRFDRCDECHGSLAEADRLSGICPSCEEMLRNAQRQAG